MKFALAALCLWAALLFSGPPPSAPHRASGKVLALMGGGTDQDAAFRWLCKNAGSGQFLVLRATGTNAYDPYIQGLCPASVTVSTLIIPSRSAALQPETAARIRSASALFLSGGSQDNYFNFWQGTPVQQALASSVQSGVPLGGTSAGLAVLGEYAFAALKDTITSGDALANPYDERVTITRGFLHLPYLQDKITDSHFVARDRMGRLLVFLPRISQDSRGAVRPSGIGIDEKNAVLVDAAGRASVTGLGAAYFVRPSRAPGVCRPAMPLTYIDLAVYRLKSGAGVNVR